MKTLKFDHRLAELILKGEMTNTWRIFDDKDLAIDDQVSLIDKVEPHDPNTWRSIGIAKITSIVQKHLGDITSDDMGGDRSISPDDALKISRRYYGPNVTLATPVKIIFFTFTPLTAPRPSEPLLHAERAIVYADGASRGNPGPSAAGYVVYDDRHILLTARGSYLGVTTNNQAEYTALKLGLEEAKRLGAHEVQVYMDSLLVINQMKGRFKVSNRDLWPIHESVRDLCSQFTHVVFAQIPRELNKAADTAANNALDAHAAATGV